MTPFFVFPADATVFALANATVLGVADATVLGLADATVLQLTDATVLGLVDATVLGLTDAIVLGLADATVLALADVTGFAFDLLLIARLPQDFFTIVCIRFLLWKEIFKIFQVSHQSRPNYLSRALNYKFFLKIIWILYVL